MQVDAGLDEVRAQAAFRQLQPSPRPGDGVVVADRALLDDTENLAPGFGAIRPKALPSCSGAIAKALLYSPI